MNPRALADCAEALGCTPREVEQAHDSAELLPWLLARVVLNGRQQAVQAAEPGDTFCRAVVDRYGAGEPFTAADLMQWCDRPSRMAVRDAAAALCRTDGAPTARQLGMALAQLAKHPPLWFVVEAEDARGTRLWRVRDLAGPVPPVPQAGA